jgi:methionine biosynthesis protein MetW
VLRPSQERILERLGEDDLVLDIGGWASPFARADWVLDLMPYDTRSPYEWSDRAPDERFTKDTWVERDICDKEPYPFHDDQFDFVVCAQTLEDVRDPIWVCSEMRRIGKAGYIEVPSRLLEQTRGVQDEAWVGYGHHHWLIDVQGDRITFVFKHHIVNRPGFHFPAEFADTLRPDEHAEALWWEGSFEFEERIFFEPAETDAYLQDFVTVEMRKRGLEHPTEGAGAARGLLERARRAVGGN